MKPISELRQDLVSGEWVLVSTNRAHRPHSEASSAELSTPEARAKCPFENPQASGNPQPIVWRAREHESASGARDRWFVQVIPNKYPAVFVHKKNICAGSSMRGPYAVMDGIGYHEVVITRDHDRSLGVMNSEEVKLVLDTYRARYLALQEDPCIAYILIFHNHGVAAGASLAHPHSQLVALPIVPPDISQSFAGSAQFYKTHGVCVHCRMIEEELRTRRRVVYENEAFVVFAPYASHTTYELRIYPKTHEAHFEMIADEDARLCADALATALGKIYRALANPPYNFFIHTAPVGNGKAHYHWHLEILPKLSVPAGLELGTGVDVVVVAPEDVPQLLSV